jgi:hypothetical protein
MNDKVERFSAGDPCPICGGHDGLPRGQGRRCFGFFGSDRKYAHCSREEHCGGLAIDTNTLTFAHRLNGDCRCGVQHGDAPEFEERAARPSPRARIAATYDYVDERGKLLFQAVRYVPKMFGQRRPDGRGGWINDLKGVRRVPYRLDELIRAERGTVVFVVEGEKDADRLRQIGVLATTCPMGAGKWKDEYSAALAELVVVILPDNDKPGRDHARAVAASALPHAASVRIIDLAAWTEKLGLPDLPEKGDVSDFLGQGGEFADIDWIVGQTKPVTKADPPLPDHGMAILIRLSDVQRKPVEWFWQDRFALGGLNLLFGDPGDGKSFLTIAMAAARSRGAPWPDLPGEVVAPASILLLSAEDSLATTIGPRLDAAGADSTRVHALTTVRMADGRLSPFTIRRDVPVLDDALTKIGDCRLLVIDPVSSYLGGADEHKNAEVREVIGPLTELAERHNVCIVMVTHLNKGTGPKALYRSTGSLAFVAASRMAWMLCRDKDDRARRLLLPAKANIAADPSGMAFRIVEGVIQWETEPIRMWADDALNPRNAHAGGELGGVPPTKVREAMTFLTEQLARGPERHGLTLKAAEEAGISKGVFYRALDLLGVERFEIDGLKMLRLADGVFEYNDNNKNES